MALHSRNQRKVDEIFAAKGEPAETAKVRVNYFQFASNAYELLEFNKLMTGNIGLSVEIRRRDLTINLPFYYYQSAMKMDRDNPLNSFNAESPIFNAGTAPNCYQRQAEFVPELPVVLEN